MSYFRPIPEIDFRRCKLHEGDEWFIFFWVMNPTSRKLKRVRIKINRIKDVRQRRRTAREIMAAIDQKLVLGWNPFLEKKAPQSFSLLFDVFDKYIAIKEKEMEEGSIRVYRSLVKSFKVWLEGVGFDNKSYACSITHDVAQSFINKIEEEKSARTYNNQLAFFFGLFKWMVEKGYASDNPFAGIAKKSKRLIKGKNRRMLSDQELSQLIAYLKVENKEYLAMMMMCYCCFIRPKEIALLRCSDLDLEKQVVHISGAIAKNDNESYRTIPDEALPYLRVLDLSKPSLFLFGDHPLYDFTPSRKLMCSRKIAKYWEFHVRKHFGWGQDVKFYSLKDTGITNMLNEGVPINLVQQQADHYSVAMTAKYVGKKNDANGKLKKTDIIRLEDTVK